MVTNQRDSDNYVNDMCYIFYVINSSFRHWFPAVPMAQSISGNLLGLCGESHRFKAQGRLYFSFFLLKQYFKTFNYKILQYISFLHLYSFTCAAR